MPADVELTLTLWLEPLLSLDSYDDPFIGSPHRADPLPRVMELREVELAQVGVRDVVTLTDRVGVEELNRCREQLKRLGDELTGHDLTVEPNAPQRREPRGELREARGADQPLEG